MKACKLCFQEKPDSLFALSTLTKSGISSRCKSCKSEQGKIRYKNIKSKAIEQAIKYREANHDKRLAILHPLHAGLCRTQNNLRRSNAIWQ
jgi:hypothetical protein